MARSRRVPPPPVIREQPVVERVPMPDDEVVLAPKRKRNRGGSTVDVTEVGFTGVAKDTESKVRRRLMEAATAFERERFGDAQRMCQSIEKLAPGAPEVAELLGLSYYRQGKWREAIRELERFEALTGTVEQHPVLADCFRARGDYARVAALWIELGEGSPSAELVEEGRIVSAGALADQGKVKDAIRMLETAPKAPKKLKIHHLRRWYALADLYERGGDLKRAKRLFTEIEAQSPGFGDVAQRIRMLR
jgi:tetratricopeptide (TPR) repeat protein